MARGNDAIPTWSGFNYQGKIMLLYILTLINGKEKDDKGTYSVELEKTEDFCILCDSEYISFHQVKAWLSTTKWSSYSEAMVKLQKHKSDRFAPNAKCYLMAAKEIEDWDDDSNTYHSSIELYKYGSNVIGVDNVRDLMIQEIEKYLDEKGYDRRQADIVYGELCLHLDDKIATMHKQGASKRSYIIPFAEFTDKIEEAVEKGTLREEYYLKERVYKYVTMNIEQALDNFCHDECGMDLKECDEVCAAKAAHNKMMEISDYTIFCKLLNPSKIDGWDNPLAMAEYFPAERLQNEIYDLLYHSRSPEKIWGDGNAIYLESEFSNAKSGQIIPTLLDLTRGRRGGVALQRIFQNIVDNTDIVNILEGNSITVIPGDYRGRLTQADITSGWKESNPEDKADNQEDEITSPENKISHYYRDIELISSEELRCKFGMEEEETDE